MMRAFVLACSLVAIGGCCGLDLELDGDRRRERSDDDDDGGVPSKKKRRVDLGTAEHPDDNDAKRVRHPWTVPALAPSRYELGYRLGDDTADGIYETYHAWARRVSHKKLDRERFQWRPPKGCHGGLHCVYDALDDTSAAGIRPITERFRRRAQKENLNARDISQLVIGFVQEIEYRIPEEEPFGVMPPALVVRNKWGDCDSKTLLAHMMLRSLGIQTVVISSEAHKHTMMGIALPSAGRSFKVEGKKYAFVELTARRSPIGHLNPKLLRPNDWKVVQLRPRPLGPSADKETNPLKRAGGSNFLRGKRIKLE